MLAAKLGWPAFSSGGKFKQLIDDAGPLSERIRSDYERGHLSPDWLAAYLFEQAVVDLAPDAGIVCEGFPRSLPQAQLADEVFRWLERPYKVIHLKVGEEEALKRQLNRAKTEDRPDSDGEEKVQTRFEVYRSSTEPIVDFFKEKGTLIEINGEQTPEAIALDISAALNV